MNLRNTFLPGLFLIFLIPGFQAEATTLSATSEPILKTHAGSYRFTFEELTMPNPDERMGILGFNYLLNLTSVFYGGIGGYGAMTGERGGFLTGGFEGGLRYPLLERLTWEAGMFVGGGGGSSSTGQGGGLMLRPHIGLIYDLVSFRLGLFGSKVTFPNGEIHSDQIGISIDIPFMALFSNGMNSTPSNVNISHLFSQSPEELKMHVGFATEEILLSYQTYLLQNNSSVTMGNTPSESMNLMGAEFRHYFINQSYFSLQTAGETGGTWDGYAEIFFGGGYQYKIESLNRLSLTGSFSAGSGGGGGLNSGGGALGKILGGIEYQSGTFKSQLETGYIKSANGNLSASIVGVQVGFVMEPAIYQETPLRHFFDEQTKMTGWNIRASHQIYFRPQRKIQNIQNNIELIGLKADRILSKSLYLTGQALSAYNGHAGGYSAGLFGMGWESPKFYDTQGRLKTEILFGAGGGGGLPVGGGAIIQPMIGLKYDMSNAFSTEIMAGQIKSFAGELSSTVFDLSLVYHFATLERQ